MNGCRSDSLSGATVQYTKRVQWHLYPKGEKKSILTMKIINNSTKY